MNIFKKLSLINKILKLSKELKQYFDKHVINDKIKEKIQNIVKNIQELGDLVPELNQEIYEIAFIIKKYLCDDKKDKLK